MLLLMRLLLGRMQLMRLMRLSLCSSCIPLKLQHQLTHPAPAAAAAAGVSHKE
jgi:hypothetical protein